MNKPLDPAATVTRAEVEDFLYHEADLLDSWRLDDWLGLLTEDARYYVPPNDKPDGDHRFTLFTVADDIVRLRERIIRLKDPNCHAEYPPSHTRRLITNVRITGMEGDLISGRRQLRDLPPPPQRAAPRAVHRPLPLQAQAHRRRAEDPRAPRHPRCGGTGRHGGGELSCFDITAVMPGACAGHPRTCFTEATASKKTWMAGTSPAMTSMTERTAGRTKCPIRSRSTPTRTSAPRRP